jgi:hypothetical protein
LSPHVFAGYQGAQRVGIRRDDMPPGQVLAFASQDFAEKLVTGSDQQSYDYAILNIPQIIKASDHQFTLETPGSRRVGEQLIQRWLNSSE